MANIVGGMAMIASLVLNLSPAKDVYDIHRTKRVGERSILPYVAQFVDGSNWVVYGSLASYWFPVVVTNLAGLLCGTSWALVYLKTVSGAKAGVEARSFAVAGGAFLFVMCLGLYAGLTSSLQSQELARDTVGYVADTFNILLYWSPLELTWKVIRNRSTNGMYLPLSITMFVAPALWATYGLLVGDLFVFIPQVLGVFAGLLQLSLFARYGVADNNVPVVTPGTDGKRFAGEASPGGATSTTHDDGSPGGSQGRSPDHEQAPQGATPRAGGPGDDLRRPLVTGTTSG